MFWDFVERFGCCFVFVKMGKGGIFHVFWGFVIGYVPFCFASCMVAEVFGLVKVAEIFGLVNETGDFLFCVGEDVKRRDFWGSILKACSEVVWGLGVGVERKILFLCYFFLEGIIIYVMYHVNGYLI